MDDPSKPFADALAIGRICADLYPDALSTPLAEVDTYHRFVGGFAGNVATGLARLGVRTAIVSAVGDDGHGVFVRRFLESEGVDCRMLGIHPTLRTALAFCEAWPPDHFPITFYRTPTCPDWELAVVALDLGAIVSVPLAFVTGTGLAREPSRTATLAIVEARARASVDTILDVDWRPSLWEAPEEYPPLARIVASRARAVIGGDAELEAAGLDARSAPTVVVKHGAGGATVHVDGVSHHVPPVPVEVVNGLGAGDAFAAAFGAALLAGADPIRATADASAAGALVATRLSCSAAMPTRAELDAFTEEHAHA